MLKKRLPSVNVLLTSAGRRVELIRAFQRAYRSLRLMGRIHATDVNPLAPSFRAAQETHIVPPFADPDYVPALIEIVRRGKIRLVFPLIDPDIPILAAHKAEFAEAGAAVMTPDAAGAETARDKWKTHLLFETLGIPAARSWLPENLRTEKPEFPLFIKPRRGSAGQGAFRVENERQLEFFLTYVDDPIVQECLPGPEVTSDVICGATGDVWAVVSRRRIEIRAGEVAKGVTLWDEKIARHCAEAARGIRATGPVTVQCILRGGNPLFTEINARFGGGCPLGFAAGADSPRWYLAEAAGLPMRIPPRGSYKQGLFMTRFDDSFFFEESERGPAG
ncbi:MAG: ATP-grasp domain-containing protein [Anaerolineales bacterium]|nr:ATP-grasp domain-containing protein [Anaerolineales bacterium]